MVAGRIADINLLADKRQPMPQMDEAARWARDFESAFRASGYNHSDPKYTLLFLTCDILPEVRATEAGWIRVKTGELLYAAQRLACE